MGNFTDDYSGLDWEMDGKCISITSCMDTFVAMIGYLLSMYQDHTCTLVILAWIFCEISAGSDHAKPMVSIQIFCQLVSWLSPVSYAQSAK